MKSICLYFQVHQPFRLRTYRFFDIGNDSYYYDDYLNRDIMQRIANKSYLPSNKIMLDLIKKLGDKFKVSYAISGTALDQFEMYAPEVLKSFQKLVATGNVELLVETDSHSLSSLRSKEAFMQQVKLHHQRLEKLFNYKPTTFRNTELVYSDGIGEMVGEMGYHTIVTEGAKHILGWKSPNYLYTNAINPKVKLLLRNYFLSDDIGMRFSNHHWNEWPMTADKFVTWVKQVEEKQKVVNIFLDYETFGEHHKAESGIFEFLKNFPIKAIESGDLVFKTPAEISKENQPISAIHVPYPISWSDEERDVTAWLGNEMQEQAVDGLYEVSSLMNDVEDEGIWHDWRKLQSSDHFYYMSTKWFSDGDVHQYFNPYDGPYEAFINYMNVLSDFKIRIESLGKGPIKKKANKQAKEKEAVKKVPKKKVVKRSPAKKPVLKTINDLRNVSGTKLVAALRSFDLEVLAKSLKGAPAITKDHLLTSLGKRALKTFDKLTIDLRKVSRDEVAKSRKALIEHIIKSLEN